MRTGPFRLHASSPQLAPAFQSASAPLPELAAERSETRRGEVPGSGRRGPLRARSGPGITRRHLGFAVATVVVVWLLFIFARAVAQSNAATDQVADLRAENAVLAAQLQAGQRELALIRSPSFARIESRAYGMGRTGERVFALAPGSPAAPSIRPLGVPPEPAVPPTPLEDWLTVLFGS